MKRVPQQVSCVTPPSNSSDYSVARKLQEEYLAKFEKQRENERLSEAAARKLENDLRKEREQAAKLSEQLAKQLDQEYRQEEWKHNMELELGPNVLAQAVLDAPPRARRSRVQNRPLVVDSPDFRMLRALDEESPINWNTAFQNRHSPLRFSSSSSSSSFPSPLRLSHTPSSPVSFAPLPRSYRTRRQRTSPLPARATRRRSLEVDVDRMSYEELQRLCERNGDVKDKAASSSAVSRLPTAEIKSPQEKESEDDCCSICLEPFKKKQIVKTLPCFHRFHVKEIDKWLKQNNSCPICKQQIDS